MPDNGCNCNQLNKNCYKKGFSIQQLAILAMYPFFNQIFFISYPCAISMVLNPRDLAKKQQGKEGNYRTFSLIFNFFSIGKRVEIEQKQRVQFLFFLKSNHVVVLLLEIPENNYVKVAQSKKVFFYIMIKEYIYLLSNFKTCIMYVKRKS